MTDNDYIKTKNYALRCLSAKAYYSEELRRVMRKKQFEETHVEQAIADCVRLGYLNDEEWMKGFVRGQIARQRSPIAIASKLMAKGVPSEIRKKHLAGLETSSDSIAHLLKTKYAKRNLADFKERQKVIAALARRGFPFEAIQQAIRAFKDENA